MTVQEILDALWRLAPLSYKEDFDNVGFLLGRKDRQVQRILVALDATDAVAAQAKALDCQLVVTHHPVIFHAPKHVTDADPHTRTLLTYLEQGIAVISMHTNLDCVPGGVNDVLARTLGLHHVEILADGETAGLVRMGEVAPSSLPDFAARVKQALGCPGLRYADGGKPVRRVAVGGGACGEFMDRVAAAGCDTFVTADLKYHQFCDAAVLALNLLDAGHFETENPVCAMLQAFLAERFPTVEVLLADHGDCIRFL